MSDKRALENALTAEKAGTEFLRERVIELQRGMMALANPKAEAQVVGQTNRDKAEPEVPYVPRPARWAGVGNSGFDGEDYVEPLTATLTRMNPSTTYKGPSDLRGLAQRESGLHLSPNGEGL